MQLTSVAFKANEEIPLQYTCWGEGISPDLQWVGAPAKTKSFALIVDDPDAVIGVFIHWIVINIPANVNILGEDIQKLPGNAITCTNSGNTNAYWRACPPSGTHRYFFKLYALDTMLDLDSSATKPIVERAMAGHILAEATLMAVRTSALQAKKC